MAESRLRSRLYAEGSTPMLERPSHNVRMAACFAKAAECETEGARLREPGLKQQWLDLAQQWRDLARQIEVSRY